MNLLAIDTSSDACSAAVFADGVYHVAFEMTPRAHTQLILPMVEQVLAAGDLQLADLDAIAFGRGPGAFTGVRIATGVVQGLALAANKPVVAISTLAALAQQAYIEQGAENVLVAVDARMDEVYWGQYHYQQGVMQLQGEEVVQAPAQVILPSEGDYFAVGSGWNAYPDLLARASHLIHKPALEVWPSARYIAELAVNAYQHGQAVPAALARPIYLRNKIAKTTRERLGLA